jgi:CubicO group peptidase (beta-lactamase class C family)
MKRIASSCAALAGAAVLAVIGLQSQAPAPARSIAPADVNRIFARWTDKTPGCSVGASVKGVVTISNAYGMADLEHDVPNTADTIFEAGSVAKQFTAASVLLLARDGKLSIDDPIRKYIPEVPEHDTPITIRHMLTHTSGLRDWGSVAAVQGWPRTMRVHTHAHVLEIVSRQKALNFAPGTRWSYSNTGYNLAAILVSRVSGMSFADFTRTRIFEPLGMTSTSWRDDHTRIVKRRAIAYSAEGDRFSTEMPFENVHGNGGLLTTVGDLLKWNANVASPRIWDAAFVKQQEDRGRFTSGRQHNYAFGLVVVPYKGLREVGHGGATAGYRSYLVRYPDEDVSVAVLCNAGSANAEQHARAVADMILGSALRADAPGPTLIAEAQGPVASLRRDEKFRPTATDLAAFAGTYRSDEAETTLIVAVDGDVLVVRRRPDSRIVLRPRAADTFEAGGGLGIVVFRRDERKRVAELSVVQDRVWDLRFRRQADGGGSF